MKEIFDYETRDKVIAMEVASSLADARQSSASFGYRAEPDGEYVGQITVEPFVETPEGK